MSNRHLWRPLAVLAALLMGTVACISEPTNFQLAVSRGNVQEAATILAQDQDASRVVNQQSAGLRPLNDAAVNGYTEMVSFLLSRGAKVNLPADGAFTALHSAALGGRAETARVLLSAGADPCVHASRRGSEGRPSEVARTAEEIGISTLAIKLAIRTPLRLHPDF